MQIARLTSALVLGALMTTSSPAIAAQIKISTVFPEQSAWMKEMKAAGKLISERTEGRVVFKFYGGGV